MDIIGGNARKFYGFASLGPLPRDSRYALIKEKPLFQNSGFCV
jgi:hypothetical protein